MPTISEIVLRPRFKREMKHDNQSILEAFETTKTTEFKISRVDDHVFIRFPIQKQSFWSPQLHLEVNSIEPGTSMLHGLFGPNPNVWTMFMFLHFFVAGLFIVFGIWCYTNWKLDNPYGIELGLTILTIVVWFMLYFAGRYGRRKGKAEMHQLYNFMEKTLMNNQLT